MADNENKIVPASDVEETATDEKGAAAKVAKAAKGKKKSDKPSGARTGKIKKFFKDFRGEVKPMFLCQEASELDLFGTVEGAYCSLDGMNYLPPEELPEVFSRLHLFIEPGGKFIFDFHSPERLRSLDGGTFVDEDEDMLCLWRAEFDEEEQALVYGMDIFRRKGKLWEREC